MKAFEYEPIYKKTTLSNGVRILTEHHPSSRAVCAGIFVDLGTRDEPADMVGAAHFIEHMVFKGTETRDAYEIAKSLEAVGGDLNAYTTREQTCFHATSLKENLALSLDVLCDLVCNAEFDLNDLKKERDVILQEINMSTDDNDDYIFDLAFELAFKGHELSRSILGTPKTLQSITRKKLFDFYNRRYHGENLIVSVVGHVSHDEVVDVISRSLSLRRRPVPRVSRKRPQVKPFRRVISKESEQTHILLVMPSVSIKERLRFESYVANAALGGGMTSRLYQKVREQLGLAYSIYSYNQPFSDTGLQFVYAGTSAKHVDQVLGAMTKEVDRLCRKGLTRSEIEFYKTQIVGEVVLDADDIESRMNSLGYNEMLFGQYRSVDHTVADLQRVNVDLMNSYLKKYFDLGRSGVIVIGDVNEEKTLSQIKKRIG